MTEVLFYHLQDMLLENVLPPLLEKSLERGWRVVVQSTSEERADALDAHLWTYRDDSFLPHATWRAGDAAGSADRAGGGGGQSEPGQCPVSDRQRRVARRLREPMSAWFWSSTATTTMRSAAARGAWTDCKSRGFEVTYWQADERGRWQRRD